MGINMDIFNNPIKFSDDFLKQYDFIITLGVYAKDLESDVCLLPFLDSKTKTYIRYEVGTEEGVSALFLYEFYKGNLLKDFIDELDYGYLTSETNISEEEMLLLKNTLKSKNNPLLIIGNDFYLHKRSKNILDMFANLIDNSILNISFLSLDKKEVYQIQKQEKLLETLETLPENNGCVIYLDSKLEQDSTLLISNEFAKAWKLQDKDKISIYFDDNQIDCSCKIDNNFGGVIGILNLANELDCAYRYKQAKIKKR
ncbi:MAG: hypothetical protein K2P17_07385 [Helicobacteraceae bacterium]|nr:hypothetical protein [Helicobacteraceae bacterium]